MGWQHKVICLKLNEEWSSQLWTQFMQLRKKVKKIQDFNRSWTRELAIPVRCSNQLRYEATAVGSLSIICSYLPVKEMNVIDVYEYCVKLSTLASALFIT